jgi:hypothetical protein
MISAICFGAMVLTIWFLTEFKTHLFNTFYNKDLDSSNVNEFIFLKFDTPIFETDFTTGEMLNCPYCLGFWIAAVISIFAGPFNLPIIYLGQLILFGVVKKLA